MVPMRLVDRRDGVDARDRLAPILRGDLRLLPPWHTFAYSSSFAVLFEKCLCAFGSFFYFLGFLQSKASEPASIRGATSLILALSARWNTFFELYQVPTDQSCESPLVPAEMMWN